jgi:hypothetical protein
MTRAGELLSEILAARPGVFFDHVKPLLAYFVRCALPSRICAADRRKSLAMQGRTIRWVNGGGAVSD